MLKAPNGIRPSHLWRLTSQKDFQAVIKDRLTARKNLERDKRGMLQMWAIVIGSAMGVMFTFGHFSPERKRNAIITSPLAKKPKCPQLPICAPDAKQQQQQEQQKQKSDNPCPK